MPDPVRLRNLHTGRVTEGRLLVYFGELTTMGESNEARLFKDHFYRPFVYHLFYPCMLVDYACNGRVHVSRLEQWHAPYSFYPPPPFKE